MYAQTSNGNGPQRSKSKSVPKQSHHNIASWHAWDAPTATAKEWTWCNLVWCKLRGDGVV
jgi:hypothetical protein